MLVRNWRKKFLLPVLQLMLRNCALSVCVCSYLFIYLFWSHEDYKLSLDRTSSQGGGVGRYTLSPCTTKRRTFLTTKNNQNCQKIKLYDSPMTKKLKKKHSFRLVGGTKMGSQGGEDSQQGCGWWTGRGGGWWSRQSHICMQINRRNNWGGRQTAQP